MAYNILIERNVFLAKCAAEFCNVIMSNNTRLKSPPQCNRTEFTNSHRHNF